MILIAKKFVVKNMDNFNQVYLIGHVLKKYDAGLLLDVDESRSLDVRIKPHHDWITCGDRVLVQGYLSQDKIFAGSLKKV